MNVTFDSDIALTVLGVPGRLTHRTIHPTKSKPGCWFKQRWISESRVHPEYGPGSQMTVKLRFDDECGNGHNTFSITADVTTPESRRRNDIEAGGCLHDDIARIFPELASLIRWHLVSTDGPMHYVGNAVYLASDRDCWGKRAGEPTRFQHRIFFGNSPVGHDIDGRLAKFLEDRRGTGDHQLAAFAHKTDPATYGTHWAFVGYADDWARANFRDEIKAREWLAAVNSLDWRIDTIPVAFSEGKARELDAARRVACWPDAPDEILCADKETLTAALLERLPGLTAAFRNDMESIGFKWAPPEG